VPRSAIRGRDSKLLELVPQCIPISLVMHSDVSMYRG